jgi:RNA polymerase-associated protein RTF1
MGKSDSGEDSASSGSSSESDEAPKTSPKGNNTAYSSSSSDDDDTEWGKKNKKSNGKRGKKSAKSCKKIKASKSDDEREEGELDDDEDNFDDEMEEFNDGFDENLMGDEEDQKRLASMTDVQREQELFNRSEKREVLRTRFEIERKLKLQKKAEMNRQNKNKVGVKTAAPAAKPTVTATPSMDIIDTNFPNETSIRSTERRRNMDEKNTKKDSLKVMKELREKKKLKQQKLRAADVYSSSSDSDSDDSDDNKKSSRKDRRRQSSSSSSDSSSDSSDEDKNKSSSRRKKDKRRDSFSGSDKEEDKEDFDVTLEVLDSVRLSRTQLSQWVHAPFFPTTVINSFVKVGIGQKVGGEHVYRVCQVLDVVEGPKTYNLEKAKTNKIIKVRHGKDERSFRMEFVSNAHFTDKEFSQWKEAMEKGQLDMPSRSMIESKKKDIVFATNYRFTNEDIEIMLREKEKFEVNPKNYAVRKTHLMKLKEHADQAGDEEESERLQAELDKLEDKAKELDQKRSTSIAGITTINERNRIRNIAEAERAIMEETLRNQQNKVVLSDDPFRRRQCAPMLYGSRKKIVIKEDGNKDESEASNEVKKEDSSGNLGQQNDPKEGMLKKEEGPPVSNDLFNAHDFDIQIDLLEIPSLSGQQSVSSFISLNNSGIKPTSVDVKPVTVTNRRSLNLEEYKKKKGLI